MSTATVLKIFRRVLAIINFIGVILLILGLGWIKWPLAVMASVLFVDGLGLHEQSRMYALFCVGSMSNYLGVVAGGIAGIAACLVMAFIGAFMLFVAYIVDPTTSSNLLAAEGDSPNH